jgi:hypothetical protein
MSLIAEHKENLIKKNRQLKLADAAMEQIATDGIESMTFDTGTYGARQHFKTMNIEQLIKWIGVLESQIARLNSKIGNRGIVRLRTSRYK